MSHDTNECVEYFKKVSCCSVLQCVAVRCSVLQCVAMHCVALEYSKEEKEEKGEESKALF